MALHNRFAIIKLWDTICAEDENIQRFIETSADLGIECVPVDNRYRYLSDKTKVATDENFDFVLHLHFDSIKINNLFSFVTLWNPTQFYHDWSYPHYSQQIFSHNDFLTSRSKGAEDHLARLMYKDNFHLPPFFELFPSSSEYIYPPENRTDRRLHYCGINWEKASGRKSRHDTLLKELDKKGKVDIYGPEKLGKIQVWEGYECYKGELPFDGHSMIESISKAGVSLVLSSPAHIESELMSNRLFEALAAGANVIADENSFVKKYMGDTALYIDKDASPEEVLIQVEAHLDWLNANPEKAYKMAVEGQNIFHEKFNLKNKIKYLYENFEKRKQDLQNRFALTSSKEAHVCCLCVDKETSCDKLNESIRYNSGDNIFYWIYCFEDELDDIQQYFAKVKNVTVKPFVDGSVTTKVTDDNKKEVAVHYGKNLTDFLGAIDDDAYFCVLMPSELMLENHINSLLKTIELEGADAARSNHAGLLEDKNTGKMNYIPFTVAITHHSWLQSCIFLFAKKTYLDTYKVFLPYLEKFPVGYFLLQTHEIALSHLLSCHIGYQPNDMYMVKNSKDINILRDLKSKQYPELFGGFDENPKSKRAIFIRSIAEAAKPFCMSLPFYEGAKKAYLALERRL